MLKNYLKIALRSIRKQKLYASINVFGLSIALGCSLLILLYVADEYSYDRFHEHAEQTYRVLRQGLDNGEPYKATYTPGETAKLFASNIPEVAEATRLRKAGDVIVYHKNNVFAHGRIIYADTNFFDVFSHQFVAGDPETALDEPYSVVITESSAEKYFGDEKALGNTLTFDQQRRFDKHPVTVTGIIEDLPHNTSYPFEMAVSYETIKSYAGPEMFNRFPAHTFVRLRRKATVDAVREKLPQLGKKVFGEEYQAAQETGSEVGFLLQPLTSIHLSSGIEREYIPSGGSNATYLYILLSVALFLVVIACVNYVNLATARSSDRAVEIGIRKTVGSSRGSLIGQHMIESIIVGLAGCLLAVGLAELLLPFFRDLTGRPLAFHYLEQWYVLPGLLLLGLLVGVGAGIYPAFYLTKFNPAAALRGRAQHGSRGRGTRNFLVLFQFTVSIILIVCTGFIFKQLQFLQHKDLGFDKEHALVIDKVHRMGKQALAFKEALLQQSQVREVGFMSAYPSRVWGFTDKAFFKSPREAQSALQPRNETTGAGYAMNVFGADPGLVPALGLEIAAGRNFRWDPHRDTTTVLINEAAARSLNWDAPVGRQIYYQGYQAVEDEKTGKRRYERAVKAARVAGVVEDYHYLSLHNQIEPVVIFPAQGARTMIVRLAPGDPSQAVQEIEQLWKEHAPYSPLYLSFLDEEFEATFQEERQFTRIVGAFTFVTILIACLGIFGLAAFKVQQRTKEIGIRKALGASATHLVTLLSKGFVRLVVIAFVVAVPLAYFAVSRWLQDFAYHVELGPWVFAGAGLLALVIALATVSYHALRAALSDPVDALRYE